MKVKHTYFYNCPFEDTSEVKGVYEWDMEKWLSMIHSELNGLGGIRNGVETLISMQDGYPTIEISMDEAEHVHLYQIIEE